MPSALARRLADLEDEVAPEPVETDVDGALTAGWAYLHPDDWHAITRLSRASTAAVFEGYRITDPFTVIGRTAPGFDGLPDERPTVVYPASLLTGGPLAHGTPPGWRERPPHALRVHPVEAPVFDPSALDGEDAGLWPWICLGAHRTAARRLYDVPRGAYRRAFDDPDALRAGMLALDGRLSENEWNVLCELIEWHRAAVPLGTVPTAGHPAGIPAPPSTGDALPPASLRALAVIAARDHAGLDALGAGYVLWIAAEARAVAGYLRAHAEGEADGWGDRAPRASDYPTAVTTA